MHCKKSEEKLQRVAVTLDEYWKTMSMDERKAFLEQLGIPRAYLYQLRKGLTGKSGKQRKPSLDLAVKIQEISKGRVKVTDLV